MKIKTLVLATLIVFSLTSCTFRLVDFTVISSKNVGLDIDRSIGVPTEGKQSYFLGLGWNIKDAMDDALENAGQEYDLLVDGVVSYSNYPFVSVVKVEGLAVSSRKMKNSMGEASYKQWLKDANLAYDQKTGIANEEKVKKIEE